MSSLVFLCALAVFVWSGFTGVVFADGPAERLRGKICCINAVTSGVFGGTDDLFMTGCISRWPLIARFEDVGHFLFVTCT